MSRAEQVARRGQRRLQTGFCGEPWRKETARRT